MSVATFLTTASITQIVSQEQAEPPLQQLISDAMYRRSVVSDSFVIEWTRSENSIDQASPQSLVDLLDSDEPELAQLARDRLRALVTIQQGGEYRLVVDDVKMRFERSGSEASMADPQKLVPQRVVTAYDGTVSRTHRAKSSSKYPRALITGSNDTRGFQFIGSVPILVALRGDKWLPADHLSNATTSSGTSDGRPVAILQFDSSDDRHRFTLWCDPEKNYSVVRLEKLTLQTGNRLTYNISLQFDQATSIWIPAEWEMLDYAADGALLEHRTSRVLSYEIGSKIRPEEFLIEFPPGTYVRDKVNNEEYIQLRGGDRRIITPAELEASLSYEGKRPSPPFLTGLLGWRAG